MIKNAIERLGAYKASGFFSFFLLLTVFYADFASAQEVNDIVDNVATSSSDIPGLIAAFSYLLGIILGITGVLKIRDHVENPAQTKLQVGVIRLLVGGALFALPIVYEAVYNTIGNDTLNVDPVTVSGLLSGVLGTVASFGVTGDFNNILANIADSTEDLPGLISIAAYLLGLIITVLGVLKIKDHVEGPEQTPLREGVVRLLAGGALLAIPTIYNAMFDLGDTGLGLQGMVASIGLVFSSYGGTVCNPAAGLGAIGAFFGLGGGNSVGDALCQVVMSSGALPVFLTVLAYVMGLILGIWGIVKLRDHVLNPSQTALSEGVSRLIAGGFFFALPYIIEVARSTIAPATLTALSLAPTPAGYNETAAACGAVSATGTGNLGLDGIVSCMMGDIMGPLHIAINFFSFAAGIIFIMIGISRLIKSAQEGARGPGGLGTIMTFLVGGALISYNELVRGASTSLFGSPTTATFATLQYTKGMSGAEINAAHTVISSILKFVIVVGLISFVRGLFIIRSVAEGNQQASIMAGVTHIIAGALAVNLGPLINAVQSTLGIGNFGIAFS